MRHDVKCEKSTCVASPAQPREHSATGRLFLVSAQIDASSSPSSASTPSLTHLIMFSLARSSLPRSALCATRSAAATPSTSAAAAVAAQGSARTFVTSLKPSLYTAEVSSTGSRAAGKATTKVRTSRAVLHPCHADTTHAQEGNLEITMGMPKEMGGNKGPEGGDANPEQLHAMALSTCFLSALNATHGRLFPDNKPLPKDTTVDASVSIGKAGGELPVRSPSQSSWSTGADSPCRASCSPWSSACTRTLCAPSGSTMPRSSSCAFSLSAQRAAY